MQKRFMNVPEVSQYLGFKDRTIRKWVRLGMIPFIKINGGIRFDIEDIEQWLEKQSHHHEMNTSGR